LAHGEGIGPQPEGVAVRPITRFAEPAPFTRIGPGVGGAMKPDFIDVGGTLIYDPVVGRLRGGEDVPEAGVLTLHHRFLDQLFVCGSGTSYSAPLVALKASSVISRLPGASANLVRALLCTAATVPTEARERLAPLGNGVVESVCGHGQADIERANFSDDSRVILYAEDELPLDHFAIYQVPIPDLFQTEPGRRAIRVTLAFDPPVRHTRNDYAGVSMSFRLIRGVDPDLIFQHYRRRGQDEGPVPDMEPRFNCDLVPGSRSREKGTLQTATVSFSRNIEAYGDAYYLVVRCETGWATEVVEQRFAVVVEVRHDAQIQLYERLRQRVRLQA